MVLRPVPIQFGEFVLDVERHELRQGAARIALQPKTFALLAYFCAHPQRLIGKDELLQELWPGVIVTENSVTRCVKDLRRALGEEVERPRYIETVPRMGYRFLVVPQPAPESAPSPAVEGEPVAAARVQPRSPRVVALTLAILVATAGVLWLVRSMRIAEPVETRAAPVPILAVLPFVVDAQVSGPDGEALGDGLASDLLDRLGRVAGLRVIARASSFAFRNREDAGVELNRALSANWILDGRVHNDAGALRIEARLLEAGSARTVWSRSFRHDTADWQTLQAEIAAAVAAQILQVPAVPVIASPSSGTDGFDAYLAYLVGLDHLERRRHGWRAKALAAFERSIALDPASAPAYAGVAIIHALGANASAAPQAELARAEAAAARALELDPGHAMAHAARGLILQLNGRDAEAEAALRAALALDPALSSAHNWLQIVLARQERWDESRAQLERALVLDPLNPVLMGNYGNLLQSRGDLDGAQRMFARILQLPDPPVVAVMSLASLALDRGRLVEALGHAEGIESYADPALPAGALIPSALVYARLGMCAEAQGRLRAARSGPVAVGWAPHLEAIYRVLGRTEELASLVDAGSAGPDLPRATRHLLGRAAVLRGDYALGLEYLASTGAGSRSTPEPGDTLHVDSTLALAFALQRLDRPREARSELDAVLQAHARAVGGGLIDMPAQLYYHAMALHLAGQTQAALAALSRAQAQGWNDVFTAWHDPRWRDLREDPRFRQPIDQGCARILTERQRLATARSMRLPELVCPPRPDDPACAAPVPAP